MVEKIAVIGQGYVGLTISAYAAKHFQVVGFDLNSMVVAQLNKGISHIEGVKSEDIKAAITAGNYRATANGADISAAIAFVLSGSRPTTTTLWPCAFSVRAAAAPMPSLAPVITIVLDINSPSLRWLKYR